MIARIAKAFLIAVVALSLFAAKKGHDWKTGTLQEVAHVGGVVQSPPTFSIGGAAATAAAMATLHPKVVHWQGYRIEGNGYRFLIYCDVSNGKVPNVTVHGPVKYALEDGTFFMLDEDGREFRATVLEKALLAAPGATAPPQP